MIIGISFDTIYFAQQESGKDYVRFGVYTTTGIMYEVIASETDYDLLVNHEQSGRDFINSDEISYELKANAFLPLFHKISENTQELYGFFSQTRKELFMELGKVNGIGTKTSLSILNVYNKEELIEICKAEDLKALKECKGIGTASARKIIISLKKQWSI